MLNEIANKLFNLISEDIELAWYMKDLDYVRSMSHHPGGSSYYILALHERNSNIKFLINRIDLPNIDTVFEDSVEFEYIDDAYLDVIKTMFLLKIKEKKLSVQEWFSRYE